MLELRAFSTAGRSASLAAASYPVRSRLGSFSPLPNEGRAPIVRAVNSLEEGPQSDPSVAASRSYLSSGLAAPDAVMGPRGWLIDIRA